MAREARCVRAWCKGAGNFRFRFDARRRMPLAALGLKEYAAGTGPVSKTADKEHTATSLGNSEVLSVKHAVAGYVTLDLPCTSHSGPLQAEVEAADAGERAAETHVSLPRGA